MKKRKIRIPRLLLILLLAFACLAADSSLRIVTTEYELAYPNLPEAFSGFRILQLSDVHGAVFGEGNARLLRRAAETAPDVIVLTGDLADRHTDLADTDALLAGLVQIAPVFYVSGNHEWSAKLLDALDELLQRHGVMRLENDYLPLERGGERILLAGVDDPNGWMDMEKPNALLARLRREYPAEFVLLLGHRNDWPEKYPELPAELILCGHAHGGLIRLPGVGGLLGTDRTLFPDYTAGVYPMRYGQMLVSRGLGSSTAAIPRLFNNPELVAITLKTE